MNKKILIQRTLSLEFEEVKRFLADVLPIKHAVTGSIYNKGKYKNNDNT